MVKRAQANVQRAIEATYQDTVTIVEHQKIEDEDTKLISYEDVTIVVDQPCRLSYKNVEQGVSTTATTKIAQKIKLFLSPSVAIAAGSKLVISHLGETVDFSPSGIPAIYVTHQEVVVDYFKRWA